MPRAPTAAVASGIEPQKPTCGGESHSGEVDAEHVERAVREVHYAGDAEDQRKPGRDEEERARRREAIQELQQDRGTAHAILSGRLGNPGAKASFWTPIALVAKDTAW